MTCETCAHGGAPIPEANREVMTEVGLRVVGPLTIALAELAQLQRNPKPVWVRPASRWASGSLPSVATDKPQQILGQQADRLTLTVRNTSAAAADTVWIGATASAVQGCGHPAIPLRGGAPALELATTAEVWVFALAATVGTSALAWTTTEIDLP